MFYKMLVSYLLVVIALANPSHAMKSKEVISDIESRISAMKKLNSDKLKSVKEDFIPYLEKTETQVTSLWTKKAISYEEYIWTITECAEYRSSAHYKLGEIKLAHDWAKYAVSRKWNGLKYSGGPAPQYLPSVDVWVNNSVPQQFSYKMDGPRYLNGQGKWYQIPF